MRYDIERDPGRTYETDPAEPSTQAGSSTVLGLGAVGVASAMRGLADTTGGGSVSLRDTIAQIAQLQRAVQDQNMLITSFLKSNAETMQLVRSELAGSVKGYDQQMIAALTQAEASLRSSLTALQQASTALDRVRAI